MIQTLRNAWKIPDLRKKLLFTVFILLIYRFGSSIPVPYIDQAALSSMFTTNFSNTIFGFINAMSGGAFSLATIFALLPMALGITGHGGFISQPLAIVVIGGLVSSTVLTLIVLPTLYNLVEGARERRADRRRAKSAAAGEGEDGADAAADAPDGGGSAPGGAAPRSRRDLRAQSEG